MMAAHTIRQLALSLVRLLIVAYGAVLCANYLNGKNFADHISKTLIKIHADANLGVDAAELARLLQNREYLSLQKLLDRNYNVYALVITDCKTLQEQCPEQKLLFATNPQFYGTPSYRIDRLGEFPHVVLRAPAATSVLDLLSPRGTQQTARGEIIGRVYSISTIPTFAEDYRRWIRDPFRDNELWRRYLVTMVSALLAGGGIWLIVELFLKIRRGEQRSAARREAELMASVASYLRQLEENEAQIKEREQHFFRQFEAYVERIREMEERLQDVTQYRDISARIISELEDERNRQAAGFREELARTEAEKQSLQQELARYRAATPKEKVEASRTLAQAITPQFANGFEKRVFTVLSSSPAVVKGERLVLPHLDMAGAQATSKELDFVVVTRSCVMVLEVKNYWGRVTAEGDVVNSRWFCTDGSREPVEVRSSWGVNPYHQVREYAMSVMNLLQQRQPQWRLPVYGLVVFPESADLAAMDERLGRYYRLVRSDRLLAVLDAVDAEARREHAFGKRPAPAEIENVLRGRR